MFIIWRSQYCKDINILWIDPKMQCNHNHISEEFICSHRSIDYKIYIESKRVRITKAIMKNKNTPFVQTYYRAMVSKKVSYWHQDRQIDRWEYTHTYSFNYILTNVQIQLQWIKDSLLNGAETTGISYAKNENKNWQYRKFTHNGWGTNIKLYTNSETIVENSLLYKISYFISQKHEPFNFKKSNWTFSKWKTFPLWNIPLREYENIPQIGRKYLQNKHPSKDLYSLSFQVLNFIN